MRWIDVGSILGRPLLFSVRDIDGAMNILYGKIACNASGRARWTSNTPRGRTHLFGRLRGSQADNEIRYFTLASNFARVDV